MTAFWKNLHRLAQGQLFNGGYLVEPAPAPRRNEPAVERIDARKHARNTVPGPLPARLAACR